MTETKRIKKAHIQLAKDLYNSSMLCITNNVHLTIEEKQRLIKGLTKKYEKEIEEIKNGISKN